LSSVPPFSNKQRKETTHHNTPSKESSHVFHLLSNFSVFDILNVPARKEQQNVAGDGQKCQWVQSNSNEDGAFSSAHVVRVKAHKLQTSRTSVRYVLAQILPVFRDVPLELE